MTSTVTIRPLVAADAPRLAACFERCYGDTYVTNTFYDPAAIAARIDAGELRSVVAVADDGEIVGHMGLTLRTAGALTADAGNTVVDPRYRNQKLAGRLGLGIFDLCRDTGLVGFHHYATTAHPIMQKLAAQGGGIETGIMLGYVPAGTEYRDLETQDAEERQAAVIIYQPIAKAPAREIIFPARYAATLGEIYRRAELERAARPGTDASRTTAATAALNASRGMLRIEVERIGTDIAACTQDAVRAEPADLVQVDLPLADPAVETAVDALTGEGFFFCAVLPEYSNGDVLRLQRLPAGTPPKLVMEPAQALLAFIIADAEAVA